MKQTVTINLAGIVYHIDDDAYETLNTYLKSIESHLEESDSKDEIMQDIEARIAELFSQHLKFGHIEVVNINLVNDVTAQLGTPEMITEGEEASETAEETRAAENVTEQPTAKPLLKRKFFRDTDNQIIGGVCAGLAQLIGIDTIWVRLIFLALFFLEGTGFFIYLLLWIIVPAANTAARRLEMRGIEPSADNIKAEVERTREQVDENGNIKKQNNASGCLRTIVIAIAVVFCAPFVLGFLGLIIGLLFGGFGILMGAIPVAGIVGINGGAISSVAFAAIAAIAIFLIPVILLIIWAIHRNKTNEPIKSYVWITAAILWIAAFITLLCCGLNIAKGVHELEGKNFEEKMETLGERIEQFFENGESTIIINGDTISIGEIERQLEAAAEEAELQENIDQLNDEFGNDASEGILEVTEE